MMAARSRCSTVSLVLFIIDVRTVRLDSLIEFTLPHKQLECLIFMFHTGVLDAHETVNYDGD